MPRPRRDYIAHVRTDERIGIGPTDRFIKINAPSLAAAKRALVGMDRVLRVCEVAPAEDVLTPNDKSFWRELTV